MNRLLIAAGCFVVLNVSSVHAGTSRFLGKTVDGWRKELSNSDASVRRSAAFALGRMGEEGRSAVSQLVKRLQEDTDAGVRDMAASAIGDIARALNDNNAAEWKKCGGILVKLLTEDPSERVRRSAAYALGAFGSQATGATEALIKALGDDSASVRQNAAWALGRMGEAAGDAVSKLCACLKDKDTLVRRDAAGALGRLGKAGAKASRPLIELVRSEPDAVVRKMALASLVPIAGPEQADFAKDLVPLLDDKDPKIRLDTAIVLAQIGGEESGNAVSVLKAALKDAETEIQEQATAALATLGPLAKPAMYDLADTMLDTKNPVSVRRNAALAISHIGSESKAVAPSLAMALQGSQPQQVRKYAAEALTRMKYPANEKAVPSILRAIEKDTDAFVRTRCILALIHMDLPEFKDSGAQKLLEKVLHESSGGEMAWVRYTAAYTLAQLLREDAPDKTADVLLEWLADKTVVIYNNTDARVEGAGTEATAGRANFQVNLGNDARYVAAKALSWLGNKAAKRPDVVAALRKAAKDNYANLRNAAKKTLEDLNIQ